MNHCATCQHYSQPGTFSSRCLLGPPDWAWVNPNSPFPPCATVRADNECDRWTPRQEDIRSITVRDESGERVVYRGEAARQEAA